MNAATLFLERARASPNATAIIEERHGRTVTISFSELERRSRHAAAELRAGGVTKGAPVLLFHPPSADLYAVLIGLIRTGAVAVVIDPAGGRVLLRDACALLPPMALFASPRAHLLRLVVPALRRIPAKFTSGWTPLPARTLSARTLSTSSYRGGSHTETESTHIACVECDDDDLALVTFTSGSTGQPKGARRTHGILRAQHEALRDIAAQQGDADLVTLPIVVLSNLAAGATTVLPNASSARPRNIDAGAIARQLDRRVITRITASPAIVDALADHAIHRRSPFDAVHLIVTGGGPVFPDIIDRASRAAPNARMVSVYGSTEAEPITHIDNRDVSPLDRAAMESGAGLLVGRPVRSVQLRIMRDPLLRDYSRSAAPSIRSLDEREFAALSLPTGEAGEIVVTGDHVVRGYVNGIGNSETKFRVAGIVWHRTGDMGRLDDHGRLWLLGRCSAAIHDARGTAHPFAVECAARSRMRLRDVALVQWQGERVLVVSAPRHDHTPTVAEAQTAIPWAAIDRVITVACIPVDARHNSKVNYPALLRLLARSNSS